MRSYLPFLVIGVAAGSIYGVAAMGLVLTYKTSGLFNFGHGALAAASAYIFFELRQRQGLPWPVAAVVSILIFGVVAGLVMERLAEGLARVSTAYKIVATIGLLVAIRGALSYVFGTQTQTLRPFLPQEVALTVSGVIITYDNLITFAFGVVAAVALYTLFRRTRLGTAMRAVVDDPQLLDLTGVSPVRVRRTAWTIGTTFAAASGVLFASTQQSVDVTLLSLLVVQAFGAAAIGAFTSLPLAYAGGLLIGVGQAVLSKQVATTPSLQGLDTNIPFIVLFLFLLVIPRHRLVELGRPIKARVHQARHLSASGRWAVGGTALTLALVLPAIVGERLPIWNHALSLVLLFASLALLVRTSGQISLCQIGFAAVGAAWFARLLANGMPWGVAVLCAGLIAVPVGAVISIPAIRLSGVFLALATLGFGILLAQYLYTTNLMFGARTNLSTARPAVLGLDGDTGYYYLLLAFAIAGLGLVVLVERSRLGRLLRAMADSPLALTTLGTNVNVTRVLVFCLASFMAGVSGALFAGLFGSINGDAFHFVNSIIILAVLVIAGRSSVVAAVGAPLLMVVLPSYVENPEFGFVLELLFGLAAIAVALLSQRDPGSVLAGGPMFAPAAERLIGTTGDRIASLPTSRRATQALVAPTATRD